MRSRISGNAMRTSSAIFVATSRASSCDRHAMTRPREYRKLPQCPATMRPSPAIYLASSIWQRRSYIEPATSARHILGSRTFLNRVKHFAKFQSSVSAEFRRSDSIVKNILVSFGVNASPTKSLSLTRRLTESENTLTATRAQLGKVETSFAETYAERGRLAAALDEAREQHQSEHNNLTIAVAPNMARPKRDQGETTGYLPW
jgi:hypothetical protein